MGPDRRFDHDAAYRMRTVQGMQYAEIARIVGASRAAVRSACERLAGTKWAARPQFVPDGRVSIFTPWPSSVRPELGVAPPERVLPYWSRARIVAADA
jgi:hypothetical protein